MINSFVSSSKTRDLKESLFQTTSAISATQIRTSDINKSKLQLDFGDFTYTKFSSMQYPMMSGGVEELKNVPLEAPLAPLYPFLARPSTSSLEKS